MATVKLLATESIQIKESHQYVNFETSAATVNGHYNAIVFKPEAIPENIKYSLFNSAKLYVYMKVQNTTSVPYRAYTIFYAYTNKEELSQLTWSNRAEKEFGEEHVDAGTRWVECNIDKYYMETALNLFGIESIEYSDKTKTTVYTEKSAYIPYILVDYEETLVSATVTGQNFTSGFYNRFDAANIKWKFSQVENSISSLTAASEVFYWRKSGSSTWNSIKGSGGKCYVPANTFPAGNIEWYAAVTDNLGRVWSSPTYTISTADTAAIATPQSPKGGFANEKAAITFTWTNSNTRYNRQNKAELQWSTDNATWKTLGSVNGDTKSYTAPASTLSGNTIYWRVRAYNADNVVGEWSASASFSTVDSAAVGTPLSPSNTVEDGSGPISFIWNHANNTGTGQSAADLQWSSDGAIWNDLATISGSGKSYTAPANTFPAGTIYWRVRTYNSDDVAGAWSAPITFVSVAAPPAPVVAADSKPYTTITWQSSGQLAYNIAVDGVEYGPRFGADKTMTLKERLKNGLHRATVKVQGVYGLWSEEGAVDFQVSNAPGTEIKLKVRFDHAPRLSWSTEGAYSAFQIYRNGKLIGKTTNTRFVDNLGIGNCSYQLIGIMADGNYTESNIVKGVVCLSCTMICDLERGEWQKLELSAKSYPERNFSESQNHSSRHFCGAALPVLELSQHRNKSGSYEVAFKCRKDAEAFEALLGKVVCIKSKPADMIIGGLLDLQKLQGEFYAAYSFGVNAIYWEDYRYETDS